VLNPISISKIIRNGSEFNEFVAKKDDLFTALGWSSFEERVSIVETEWDDQNIRFSTEASTYQEIESLYNSAQSLESFLGN
jgi:carbohydrate-selective porin OprB